MRLPVVFVAAAALLAGCTTVVTLYPAVADADAVMDPRLLGNWTTTNPDGKRETARVRQNGAQAYVINYIVQGDSALFDAQLGRLGPRWVLDLTQGGPAAEIAQGNSLVLLAHMQLVVLEIGDSVVRLVLPDGDSLARALRSDELRLAWVRRSNDDVLITEPTARLNEGLQQYVRRPGVLDHVSVWRRVSGTPR